MYLGFSAFCTCHYPFEAAESQWHCVLAVMSWCGPAVALSFLPCLHESFQYLLRFRLVILTYTDCSWCWPCACICIHYCVYTKEAVQPAWGTFLQHDAKFELWDAGGHARHLGKLLKDWDGLKEQCVHVLIQDLDAASSLWEDFSIKTSTCPLAEDNPGAN